MKFNKKTAPTKQIYSALRTDKLYTYRDATLIRGKPRTQRMLPRKNAAHIPAINARARCGILDCRARSFTKETLCFLILEAAAVFHRTLGSPFNALRSAVLSAPTALWECTSVFISAS